MSEFKFACPVCGQHMACDSSQSGSVMECPTCFQKITAPQAPETDDQKFIITGTKVSDRKIPVPGGASTAAPAPEKNFPGAMVVVFILIGMAAAAAFVYRGTIFKRTTPNIVTVETNMAPAPAKAPGKPAAVVAVAPPANDTNWTLNLDGVTNFPDAVAAGRIHGQDFIVERAIFQNGALMLRGQPDLDATLNFGGALPEAFAGQSINVTTNAQTAARLTLRWKDGAQSLRENFTNGYALRLEFGPLAKNHLPGKIYLCAADETKSYIAGTFNAEIRKPRPKKQ